MTTDDRLDPDLIRANLKTKRIGRSVLVYDQTASTNDIAAEYAKNPANDGLVVFAEEQTAGRGRTGATWQSRRGDSLLFSFVLIDSKAGNELLSLACAVGVAEAVGQVGGHHAAIKWPNDIMLDGRKLAGILVESRTRKKQSGCRVGLAPPIDETNETRWGKPGPQTQKTAFGSPIHPTDPSKPMSCVIHVVGIGINCHQTQDCFPDDLQTTATSLDLAGGTKCQRVTVAKRVLTSLDSWLRRAERNRQQVIDTWGRLSTQLGQRVALSYSGKRFTGNCIGVDPESGLILQLDRGGIRMFDAAHTHIVR